MGILIRLRVPNRRVSLFEKRQLLWRWKQCQWQELFLWSGCLPETKGARLGWQPPFSSLPRIGWCQDLASGGGVTASQTDHFALELFGGRRVQWLGQTGGVTWCSQREPQAGLPVRRGFADKADSKVETFFSLGAGS